MDQLDQSPRQRSSPKHTKLGRSSVFRKSALCLRPSAPTSYPTGAAIFFWLHIYKIYGMDFNHLAELTAARVIGRVYKKRERIHRSIADLRLLPTPLHVGEFQPTIRTEVGFIRISSGLLLRDPLSRPLRHVCGPGCKRHADLTSSPPSSPLKKQGSPVWIFNIQQGLRSLRYLNRRLQ